MFENKKREFPGFAVNIRNNAPGPTKTINGKSYYLFNQISIDGSVVSEWIPEDGDGEWIRNGH